MPFRALVTNKTADGSVRSSVEMLEEAQLPPGNVTVAVEWAGFNYKDGLALLGKGGIVRRYPHVGGIDFAGTVRASEDARYAEGDQVVLTGWRVGETHWGGFGERARVDADWLVPLPPGWSTRDAMVAGTAGLTAMLAIGRLQEAGVTPDGGEVLLTGAAGGVGSIAVSVLARLGYRVVAMTGRPEQGDMLVRLGAASILDRAAVLAEPDKQLETGRWAGAVDCVGGAVLGKLLRQIKPGGAVAALGNAGGNELQTTVLPFILRGVALLGIDSVMQPYAHRVAAWAALARHFDREAYAGLVQEAGLEELPDAAARILAGQVKGRILVAPNR